jgi:TRAP-type C4-dicarboxylate transport system permease small subunit
MTVRFIVGKAMDFLAVGLFSLIFIVVLLQIFLRYALGNPLTWSEELVRYVFIWISFLGWVYATRAGTHIRITALMDALPGKFKSGVRLFNLSLSAVFSVILCYHGWGMAVKSLDVPTVTLFFPFAAIYAVVPLANLLILFYIFFEFRDAWKGTQS